MNERYGAITFSAAVYHAMQASCRFNFDAWMIDINIVRWTFSTLSPPHLDLSISLQPRPRCLHGHVIFAVSWFSHPLFCTFDGLVSLHLNIPRKKKHLLVFGGKNVTSQRVTRNKGTYSWYVRSVSNSCLIQFCLQNLKYYLFGCLLELLSSPKFKVSSLFHPKLLATLMGPVESQWTGDSRTFMKMYETFCLLPKLSGDLFYQ